MTDEQPASLLQFDYAYRHLVAAHSTGNVDPDVIVFGKAVNELYGFSLPSWSKADEMIVFGEHAEATLAATGSLKTRTSVACPGAAFFAPCGRYKPHLSDAIERKYRQPKPPS